MNTLHNLPTVCPSCGKRLKVKGMHCSGCGTEITGDYRLPALMQLSPPDQAFVLEFVRSSGSLKEMSRKLSLSYPTVRNRLDEIIETLKKIDNEKFG